MAAHTENSLREYFEWFHRNPELSFEEYQTTEKIKEILEAAGVEILPLPLRTGLVAVIRGKRTGKTVALRGDIDALPIGEESGVPYSSEREGRMHACGHDFHTTAALGAAIALHKRREELEGTVKVVFQPGEESSRGALLITESGVLKDVSVMFGIHGVVNVPVGTVAVSAGPVTAAVDRFQIVLQGKGSHGAEPQKGSDSIVAAAQLVTALQTVVSRNLSPLSPAVVSVTRIQGGNTWNVLPASVELEGTVRTLAQEDRKRIAQRMQDLTQNLCSAFDVAADFQWIEGPPSAQNDFGWSKLAGQVALRQGLSAIPSQLYMGGEDFAYYQALLPSVYIQIGIGDSAPLHHPAFRVDPGVLEPTAKYLVALAESALLRIKNSKITE
ncbi:amidohydrolase [Clostridium minihomine]|uniref:amidohydrolase n=1 Tax=Clostridium minihomine TaxID=2045012 RepID=UPI000C7600B7|nr:amidohydrolase [Clostridium minihomine]